MGGNTRIGEVFLGRNWKVFINNGTFELSGTSLCLRKVQYKGTLKAGQAALGVTTVSLKLNSLPPNNKK